jgi:hypothetical protein
MQLTVAFTAAFFVGPPVPETAVDERDRQSGAAARLAKAGEKRREVWEPEPLRSAAGTFRSGGGLAAELSLIIARRHSPELREKAEHLKAAAFRCPPTWWDQHAAHWPWEPSAFSVDNVQIDVYALGMAVLTATLQVEVPRTVLRKEAARILKRLAALEADPGGLPPATALCQELAAETARTYRDFIDQELRLYPADAWLASFQEEESPDDGMKGAPEDRPPRLLWMHPVIMVESHDVAGAARDLAPTFSKSMRVEGGRFVAGIEWSAIAREPHQAPGAFEVPLKLLERHWAYYALYMRLDRVLLAQLEAGYWHEPTTLRERESYAGHVFDYYVRVAEARARLDSMPASAGGDEFAIWEKICEVQKFDTLVDAVERKSELLREISERDVQQAETDRVRRTGYILAGLTALTVVALAVSLTGNFLGGLSAGEGAGQLTWRVAIVAAAGILAVSIWWLVLYEGARQRRATGYVAGAGRR